MPDAVDFRLPGGFTRAAQLDVGENDGELDILINAVGAANLPDGQWTDGERAGAERALSAVR